MFSKDGYTTKLLTSCASQHVQQKRIQSPCDVMQGTGRTFSVVIKILKGVLILYQKYCQKKNFIMKIVYIIIAIGWYKKVEKC